MEANPFRTSSSPPHDPANLAAIILTFNEEVNLTAALDSVAGWAREIFVVDSYSTDETVEICLARKNEGIRVVQHAFTDYSRQWNWALQNLPVTSAWTLKLDADERVTPEFRKEVAEFIQRAPDDLHGLFFRRRIQFMGRELHWGGITENYDLRLWRSHRARFEDRPVNEHVLVEGKTGKLKSFVLHANSKSLADWLDKHNRYSSLEAGCLIQNNLTGEIQSKFWGNPIERRKFLRKLFESSPFRATLLFLYHYIFRLGFLDGKAGFRYVFLRSIYHYWIHLKLAENRLTSRPPEVVWPRRASPHPALGGDRPDESPQKGDPV